MSKTLASYHGDMSLGSQDLHKKQSATSHACNGNIGKVEAEET